MENEIKTDKNSLILKAQKTQLEIEILNNQLELESLSSIIENRERIQKDPLKYLVRHLENILSFKKRDQSFYELLISETQAFFIKHGIYDIDFTHKCIHNAIDHFDAPTDHEQQLITKYADESHIIHQTNDGIADLKTNFRTPPTRTWRSCITRALIILTIIGPLITCIYRYYHGKPRRTTPKMNITNESDFSTDICKQRTELDTLSLESTERQITSQDSARTSPNMQTDSYLNIDPRLKFIHTLR